MNTPETASLSHVIRELPNLIQLMSATFALLVSFTIDGNTSQAADSDKPQSQPNVVLIFIDDI